MLKKLLLSLALLLPIAPALHGQTTIVRVGDDAPVVDSAGHPIANALVYFCTNNSSPCTSHLSTVYTDTAGTIGTINPIVTDANGDWHTYLAVGTYGRQVTGRGVNKRIDDFNVGGASGGGGGGGTGAAGALYDAQINSPLGDFGVDTGVFVHNPNTHVTGTQQLDATREINITDAGHTWFLDAGLSNGSTITQHFYQSLSAAMATTYGINWPAAPVLNGTLQITSLTPDANGNLPLAWSASVPGQVSFEDVSPILDCNAASPSMVNDIICDRYTWGQGMFYAGPPIGTLMAPFVYQAKVCNGSASTSMACTFDNPMIPGDSIAWSGVAKDTVDTVTLPSDNVNGAYTNVDHGGTNGHSDRFAYKTNIAGGNAVTVTAATTNATTWQVVMIEVGGVDASPIDTSNTGTGSCSGQDITLAAVTTTHSDLLVAMLVGYGTTTTGNSVYTAGNGYTLAGQYTEADGGLFSGMSNVIQTGYFPTTGTYTPHITSDANCGPAHTTTLAFKAGTVSASAKPRPRPIYFSDITYYVFPGARLVTPSSTLGDTQIDIHVGSPITLLAQTAAISAQTIVTPVADAAFRLGAEVDCSTQVATATVIPSFSYTDPSNTVETVTGTTATCTTLGTNSVGVVADRIVRVKGSTPITFTTALANSPHYNVTALVEQVSTN